MTISTTANKKVYAGDGVVLAFPFPYLFLLDADLEVSIYDTVALTTTIQTITTHYTVSGAGDSAGGTVTMVTEPTATEKLIIRRVVDLDQESDYEDYNRFPAATVESNYDRLTMMVQQLQEQVDRAMQYETVVDSATVSGLITGTRAAGSVPSVTTDLLGMEWVDLDTAAIAAAVDSTAADAVSTAADVVTTNADAVSTAADAVSTAADVVSADASATAAAASAASIAITINEVTWSCTHNDQVVIDSGSVFTGVDSGQNFTFTSNRTFDITGTAGDLGALNTGTESADAWYYLIALGDTTDVTAPHIIGVTPANYASFTTADLTGNYAVYDDYKRIGCIRNKSGIFLSGSFRDGYYYNNVNPLALPSTTSTTYATQSMAVWVPPVSQEFSCILNVNGAGNVYVMTDSTVGTGLGALLINSGEGNASTTRTIFTDSSQNFDWKTSANTLTMTGFTRYRDTLYEEGQ